MRGRPDPMPVTDTHFLNGNPIKPPFPEGMQQAMFGLGCFWGAESGFWKLPGVFSTAVGFAGGHTPNPTYDEVCTGMTGHNEVVLVVFDAGKIGYKQLLKAFWESHDPTQGMRQGNDVGTQYPSGIYIYSDTQRKAAVASLERYQQELLQKGLPPISTKILDAPTFNYAETYHQQYLAKNPGGLLRTKWDRRVPAGGLTAFPREMGRLAAPNWPAGAAALRRRTSNPPRMSPPHHKKNRRERCFSRMRERSRTPWAKVHWLPYKPVAQPIVPTPEFHRT